MRRDPSDELPFAVALPKRIHRLFLLGHLRIHARDHKLAIVRKGVEVTRRVLLA